MYNDRMLSFSLYFDSINVKYEDPRNVLWKVVTMEDVFFPLHDG